MGKRTEEPIRASGTWVIVTLCHAQIARDSRKIVDRQV
jgi:hypothetical protein